MSLTFEQFMENEGYAGGELIDSLPNKKLTNEEIEFIWDALEDIPITEDDELDDNFFIFPKGSCLYNDVWAWFDEMHSVNVNYLINERELN